MSTSVVYVGLDVHKDSIVIAFAREGREAAENWKTIPNDGVRLRKALRMLVSDGQILKVCYEGGTKSHQESAQQQDELPDGTCKRCGW